MDEVAEHNRERWNALVEANAVFTRPRLQLDEKSALECVDPERRLGKIAGKNVLCLAGGGGQQSVAFALLGARVIVVDLSEGQLQRDRDAARHLGLEISTMQGDMRDLTSLPAHRFDIVFHPYSLNFVPDAVPVFQQVARVILPGGRYHFMCANPFVLGLGPQDWNGAGYTIREHYLSGAIVQSEDADWAYDRAETRAEVPPLREYRHTLSALVRGLVTNSFLISYLSDYTAVHPDPSAEPGTWDHFVSFAPPWLSFWTSWRPDVLPPS